ncbi:MAG: sulfurtransferase [Gammaproteobacteria bacterium]|nr:MAG: sulfurtransferase [Pseudomonadota bacterium]PIE38661.1 MAG: sulfurtransferase [Gammaproteobacteria bacterium]
MDRIIEFATNHWILVSTFFGLLIALFLVDRRKAGASITPQQVVLLTNRDQGVIVDVREKKDFSEGRIKGCIHIPLALLKERHDELKKYESRTLVIVDKMGQHSGMAAKTLKGLGYANVVRMAGGMAEWRGQNLPLTKK